MTFGANGGVTDTDYNEERVLVIERLNGRVCDFYAADWISKHEIEAAVDEAHQKHLGEIEVESGTNLDAWLTIAQALLGIWYTYSSRRPEDENLHVCSLNGTLLSDLPPVAEVLVCVVDGLFIGPLNALHNLSQLKRHNVSTLFWNIAK